MRLALPSDFLFLLKVPSGLFFLVFPVLNRTGERPEKPLSGGGVFGIAEAAWCFGALEFEACKEEGHSPYNPL